MIYLNLQNHINKDKDYRMLILFNSQNRESNPVLSSASPTFFIIKKGEIN